VWSVHQTQRDKERERDGEIDSTFAIRLCASLQQVHRALSKALGRNDYIVVDNIHSIFHDGQGVE
jgi:hypothetical protein